jgi:hypothetical protein
LFAVSLASLWPTRQLGRQLVLAALIVSPASLAAIGLAARPLIDWILKPQSTIAATDAAASCQTVSSVAPLAALPRGRVMAPIDLGPAILAATGHAVFAAPYHRNNDGNLAMVNLTLSAPEAARRILSDRQVDYVVLCAASPDQSDFIKLARMDWRHASAAARDLISLSRSTSTPRTDLPYGGCESKKISFESGSRDRTPDRAALITYREA